jgi:site-specific DNA-adenine methylase
MIEAMPHSLYAEAFVGMGGVFFRRRAAPKVEVINDVSRDIATFFRVLQRHHQTFQDTLKWQVTSRAEWDRLTATPPETLTDLERAARFLYLQRLAFGGKVAGRNFGISATTPAKFDMTKLAPMLAEAHERLAGVTIECLGWRDFLDSRSGRHFADDVASGLSAGQRLDAAIAGAVKRWMGWRTGRPEEREYQIPRGLPLLTGLIWSFEAAEA